MKVNNQTWCLWTHYEDNSVSTSIHASHECAEKELKDEIEYIQENRLIPIFEYKITPNFEATKPKRKTTTKMKNQNKIMLITITAIAIFITMAYNLIPTVAVQSQLF